MKLKHVGMIVVSVLAMSSAAVSAAEGDESVTTTVNGGVVVHPISRTCVFR
ncbi:pilus assembly protein [Escherichia coli]|nr:pilus assembly protein [Escherichia coli]